MSQSAKMSMLEAVANTVSGYVISILTYQIVMPLLGYNTSWSDSVVLVGVFSAISIVRNFAVRRFFARASS